MKLRIKAETEEEEKKIYQHENIIYMQGSI